jgi:large subunit ribosomal protein L24
MITTLIKRGDEVIAIAGREASGKERKRGKVLAVLPKKGRVLVEGFRLLHKHQRKTQEQPQGSIIQKEHPVSVSNVALFCPKCLKGVRVRLQKNGDKRSRLCRKCGHDFGG